MSYDGFELGTRVGVEKRSGNANERSLNATCQRVRSSLPVNVEVHVGKAQLRTEAVREVPQARFVIVSERGRAGLAESTARMRLRSQPKTFQPPRMANAAFGVGRVPVTDRRSRCHH